MLGPSLYVSTICCLELLGAFLQQRNTRWKMDFMFRKKKIRLIYSNEGVSKTGQCFRNVGSKRPFNFQ